MYKLAIDITPDGNLNPIFEFVEMHDMCAFMEICLINGHVVVVSESEED